MSKSFFDLNSHNTFNTLECIVFDTPKYNPKDKEDYWVTKTFYSIGEGQPINYWRQVLSIKPDLYNPISREYVSILYLSCGHNGHVSLRKIQNNYTKKLQILINCSECGGTGEIRFNE